MLFAAFFGFDFLCVNREHLFFVFVDSSQLLTPRILLHFCSVPDNNCFKNGILPICVDQKTLDRFMLDAEAGKCITVDLESQAISIDGESATVSFDVEPFRRHCLMNGLDDIGLTLAHEATITSFEKDMQLNTPWL